MHNLIDLRGLPPPEPLERILCWLDAAQAGETSLFHLPHEPLPLYEHLHLRRCRHTCQQQTDGSAILTLVKE